MALLIGACGGGGLDDSTPSPTTSAPVSETTVRRGGSDNEESCAHLRAVNAVSAETAQVSSQVAQALRGGGEDAPVLAAAADLADHLESSAPVVAEAYAAAAASAPASAAEAIDALAASAADTVPRLVELLRSARTAADIASLFAALGADVPGEAEGDDELRTTISRYTDVICGFSMEG